MIIETPYKAGDTVSLKLSSGEEIVARLEDETATQFILKKPMVLIMQQQGMGLAPFMFSVSPDAKFSILATTVTCVAKTEGEIAKQLINSTIKNTTSKAWFKAKGYDEAGDQVSEFDFEWSCKKRKNG